MGPYLLHGPFYLHRATEIEDSASKEKRDSSLCRLGTTMGVGVTTLKITA
jgi:hypothetical protein